MIRAAFVVLLAACTSWHPTSVSPTVLVSTKHPGKVRVTRPDFSKLVIYRPGIVGDSLVGITYAPVELGPSVQVGNPTSSIVQIPAAIALADIRRLQSRGFSAGRTLGLAGGIGLGIASMVVITIGDALNEGGHIPP